VSQLLSHRNPFMRVPFRRIVTYTIVETEKGYYVLKDRVMLLDGMQVRFLYDLLQNLIPDLDMVPTYFESLHTFQQLLTLGIVTVRPQRTPHFGEKALVVSDGVLYYGIRASVFRPELTEEGVNLLSELEKDDLFKKCMIEMDEKMAETLLFGRESP
jgi:hypothetical protein